MQILLTNIVQIALKDFVDISFKSKVYFLDFPAENKNYLLIQFSQILVCFIEKVTNKNVYECNIMFLKLFLLDL